ncbi:uncharacterized protein LOC122808991 [Protopterus annectens]|uniref:uncharacterized protein LOC122808991 n=1 Tax=Protopterus annectens TaxID=7888 RepID=UPI001CFBCF86|nr:uncharacterized protein LOC122808991 [Protopterus annectens]
MMPAAQFCKDKLRRCPLTGLERKTRDILDMVVTPDRIPQFIIPSLAVPNQQNNRKSQRVPVSLCSRRSSLDPATMAAVYSGCLEEDVYNDFPPTAELSDLSDPVTRAAMSLPHLIKVTTPYGFLTLGESPSIKRKESLFFDDEVRRKALLIKQREFDVKAGFLVRCHSAPLRECTKRLNPVPTSSEKGSQCRKTGRHSISCDLGSLLTDKLDFQLPLQQRQEESENSKCSKSTKRSRLQGLIKKHLAGIEWLRSSSTVQRRSRTAKGQ